MTERKYHAVMIKPIDNVATALASIPEGTRLDVRCEDQIINVQLETSIHFGHKFAVTPIRNGEDIVKYGEVIGIAIADIKQGEHVHVHNLDGKRGRGDKK